MKILYIYREREKNEHSIEAVFDTVAQSMEEFGHEVHKWYKPVSWRQTFRDICRLRKEGYDIYHITGDVNYLWVLFPWSKTTMTIHDIGFYKNNPFRLVIWLLVMIGCMLPNYFLKGLTCVSELTKNDIIKYLHVSGKRLHVIVNPLSLPLKRVEKTFNKQCPTILQIGTGWHKNLEGLLESIRDIKCHVEIVGQPDDADMKRLRDYNIDYTISHHIPVKEIMRKYEECDILYFVSRSEGFGMPIIEAQTVGRVVMTTNTEPTKSVANGAAMLFETEDHQAIHNGIERIVNDDIYRNVLIDRGYANAAKYAPNNIGRMYEAFYKDTFKIG